MDDHAIADLDPIADDGAGMDHTIGADLNIGPDGNVGQDNRAITNRAPAPDNRVGPNRYISAQHGIVAHPRSGMCTHSANRSAIIQAGENRHRDTLMPTIADQRKPFGRLGITG